MWVQNKKQRVTSSVVKVSWISQSDILVFLCLNIVKDFCNRNRGQIFKRCGAFTDSNKITTVNRWKGYFSIAVTFDLSLFFVGPVASINNTQDIRSYTYSSRALIINCTINPRNSLYRYYN